jgi:hypothetical protein
MFVFATAILKYFIVFGCDPPVKKRDSGKEGDFYILIRWMVQVVETLYRKDE